VGPNHPDTSMCLNNLAELYERIGDYTKAEPFLQRALNISRKSVGDEHPRTAIGLNNLAELYLTTGEYAKAKPLLKSAVEIEEKCLGPGDPETVLFLKNLAVLDDQIGDYTNAELLYVRILKADERSLGPDHPETAANLNNYAYHCIDCQRFILAQELASRVGMAQEKHLANILSFASEQQRLQFQETTDPFSLFCTLGNTSNVAQAILHYKGVVLDSMLEDRQVFEASSDPKSSEILGQLRSAKQRLSRLAFEMPRDFSQEARTRREQEKDVLSEQVEQLEADLARQVTGLGKARRALSVTVKKVQAALSKDQTLIELLRYNHYLGTNHWVSRYGGVVLADNGEPKWIPLGDAAVVEQNVAAYQKTVRGSTNELEFSKILQALYQAVWAPIETALPAHTKTIIISPDGALSFLSFATLLTPDDQFLCQKYSISYVASGRDLLLQPKPSSSHQMEIYANPDFAATSSVIVPAETNSMVVMRSVGTRDLKDLYLAPLPGTARESAALEAAATSWGWPTAIFLGTNATKAQLQTVNSPRILHLATHGFFLPEDDLAIAGTNGGRGIGGERPSGLAIEPATSHMQHISLKNPMLRSGLALAGAQTTFDAWKRGEVTPTENDGIVTAEDVGGLKLEGTWLVTLSACDTGTGEARAGEGVMGLRRGFVQAGAQNLLMTLWSVSDDETAKLMVDFYSAVQKRGNAPESLSTVQRDWLVKLRKERGVATAVKLAGPFIMSFNGPWRKDQQEADEHEK
jgi:CHAT domain-containing protein